MSLPGRTSRNGTGIPNNSTTHDTFQRNGRRSDTDPDKTTDYVTRTHFLRILRSVVTSETKDDPTTDSTTNNSGRGVSTDPIRCPDKGPLRSPTRKGDWGSLPDSTMKGEKTPLCPTKKGTARNLFSSANEDGVHSLFNPTIVCKGTLTNPTKGGNKRILSTKAHKISNDITVTESDNRTPTSVPNKGNSTYTCRAFTDEKMVHPFLI